MSPPKLSASTVGKFTFLLNYFKHFIAFFLYYFAKLMWIVIVHALILTRFSRSFNIDRPTDIRGISGSSRLLLKYVTTNFYLERKLYRLRGSKNPTTHDLIKSIGGMKSLILHDVLMDAENILSSEVPSQETDPLLHSDILDEIHSTILDWNPSNYPFPSQNILRLRRETN